MIIKKTKFKKGVTLVEVVVALTIFTMLITVVVSIFVSVLKAQRKTISVQVVQENARHVLESLSKDVRLGWIITDDTGGLAVGSFDLCLPDVDGNHSKISYQYDSVTGQLSRGTEPLTSNDISITASTPFTITSAGSTSANVFVKKLAFKTGFSYNANATKPEEIYKLDIDTTIATRYYGNTADINKCP